MLFCLAPMKVPAAPNPFQAKNQAKHTQPTTKPQDVSSLNAKKKENQLQKSQKKALTKLNKRRKAEHNSQLKTSSFDDFSKKVM